MEWQVLSPTYTFRLLTLLYLVSGHWKKMEEEMVFYHTIIATASSIYKLTCKLEKNAFTVTNIKIIKQLTLPCHVVPKHVLKYL